MKAKPAWRLLIPLAIVLLLAVAAWLWTRPPPSSVPQSGAKASNVAAAPAGPSSAPASRPEALAMSRPAASATSVAKADAADGFVDVCGHGRVSRAELERVGEAAPPAWVQAMELRATTERASLIKRLEAGPTRQRVAAALLEQDVQKAAGLAASTDDPLVYRLALQACRRDASYRAGYAAQRAWLVSPAASGITMHGLREPAALPTACSALNVERLQSLEPASALPWLMRLNDSFERRDEAAISQALYQLAQHPGTPVNGRLLSATVAEILPDEPGLGDSMLMAAAVAEDQISRLDASFASTGRACQPDALRDANRRQLCEQVVRLMPDRARDVLEARVLHALEERLGLAHSAQAMSKAESETLLKLMGEESMLWVNEPSCANFGRGVRLQLAIAQQGEVIYLRSRLKAQAASKPR